MARRLPIDPGGTEMAPSPPRTPEVIQAAHDPQADMVQDMVGEPDSGGFGKFLGTFGLPAALAGVAAAIGARHGLGAESAVAYLAGHMGGARTGAQLAFAERQQQQELAFRQQQERRVATDPLLEGMAPQDFRIEAEQRAGRPLGEIKTPQQMRMEKLAFDTTFQYLGNSTPGVQAGAIEMLSKQLKSPELGQFAKILRDGGQEGMKLTQPVVNLLKQMYGDKMTPEQMTEFLRTPEGRSTMQVALKGIAEAQDPLTQAKIVTEAAQQQSYAASANAAHALAGARQQLAAKYEQQIKDYRDRVTRGRDPRVALMQSVIKATVENLKGSHVEMRFGKAVNTGWSAAEFDAELTAQWRQMALLLGEPGIASEPSPEDLRTMKVDALTEMAGGGAPADSGTLELDANDAFLLEN